MAFRLRRLRPGVSARAARERAVAANWEPKRGDTPAGDRAPHDAIGPLHGEDLEELFGASALELGLVPWRPTP